MSTLLLISKLYTECFKLANAEGEQANKPVHFLRTGSGRFRPIAYPKLQRGSNYQGSPVSAVRKISPNTFPRSAAPILRAASSAYSFSNSAPIKKRFSSLAATAVVPEPANGSKTNAPSCVEANNARRTSRKGFWVGVVTVELFGFRDRTYPPHGRNLTGRVRTVYEVVVEGVDELLLPLLAHNKVS